jgi:hypothetical protein
MPIPVTCPSCRRNLNAREVLAGRKVKCPKCGSVFTVKAKARPERSAPEGAFTAASSTPLGARKQPMVDGFDLIEEEHTEDGRSVQKADAGTLPAADSKVPLGLGAPALLLGMVALFLSLVPFVRSAHGIFGIVSLPLSGLGLLLGLGGLIVAVMRKGQGIGFPIAGSACSLVAVAVAVVWLGWLRPAPAVPVSAPVAMQKAPEVPEAEHSKKDIQIADSTAKAPRWLDASKGPIQFEDLRVKVGAVVVSTVKLTTILDGQVETPQKYLGIQIFVGNASRTKKLDYRGWSGAVKPADINDALKGLSREGGGLGDLMGVGGKYAATVTDNFGNKYKRFNPALGDEIPGQISTATSIYPETTIEDLLVFEPPLENIQYLHLELPAGACGMTGSLYLQIPKKMIQR